MTISLTPLRTNFNMVSYKGANLYFSYETLVAVELPYHTTRDTHTNLRTSTKYSNTTTRHMNQYGVGDYYEVDQETLEQIVEEL